MGDEALERVKLLGHGAQGSAVLMRNPTSGELLVAKEIPVENKTPPPPSSARRRT